MKSLVINLLLFISLISCQTENSNEQEYQVDGHEPKITRFLWDTFGGGDMKFEAVKKNSDFSISVQRYNFKDIETSFLLTSENPDAYNSLQDVFSEKILLKDYTFEPQGSTGTWTTITVIYSNSEEKKYENISAGEDLGVIYNFVNEKLKDQ